MNLNFRRTALLVGICSAVSLTYTPQLFAASVDAIDAVQQAKKITGTVTDAMGPVIIVLLATLRMLIYIIQNVKLLLQ